VSKAIARTSGHSPNRKKHVTARQSRRRTSGGKAVLKKSSGKQELPNLLRRDLLSISRVSFGYLLAARQAGMLGGVRSEIIDFHFDLKYLPRVSRLAEFSRALRPRALA